MANLVLFEPGYATFAGMRVPVADAGTHGEIRIGDQTGCVIRPLLYGERSRAVLRYAGSGNSVASVSAAVLHMALVQPGTTDPLVAEILALVLAGAEQDAPPFSETALMVARAAGWDIRQIDQAEASAIDRLAIHVGGPLADSADDGWTRIVLVDEPRIDTLADIRRTLAERLLQRADAQPIEHAVPGVPAVPARESAHPAQPDQHVGEGKIATPAEPSARPEQATSLPAPARYPRLAFDLARLHSAPRRVAGPTGAERPSSGGGPLVASAPGGRQAAGEPFTSTPSSPSPGARLPSAGAAPRPMENVTATMHTLATARLSLQSRPAGTTAGIRDTGAATTPVAQHNALAAWPPATAQLPPQPVALAEHHTPFEPHSSEVLPAATEVNDAGELADALAALLDLEADLRGIAR